MNEFKMKVVDNLVKWADEARNALEALGESKVNLEKAQQDLELAKQKILVDNRNTPENLGKNEAMREATINQALAPLVEECNRLEIEAMEKNYLWWQSEISWKTWKSILDSTRDS